MQKLALFLMNAERFVCARQVYDLGRVILNLGRVILNLGRVILNLGMYQGLRRTFLDNFWYKICVGFYAFLFWAESFSFWAESF